MPSLSIATSIIDNDHNGMSGVGTIYKLTIVSDDCVVEYEYGLLDALSGKFDPEKIKQPFKLKYAKAIEEKERLRKQNKINQETIIEDKTVSD